MVKKQYYMIRTRKINGDYDVFIHNSYEKAMQQINSIDVKGIVSGEKITVYEDYTDILVFYWKKQ